MKQVLVFIISLLLFTSTYAQKETLSHLKKELKNVTGNDRVDILHQIALYYIDEKEVIIIKKIDGKIVSREESIEYSDASAAKKYIDKAMKLSITNKYEDGLAASHYFNARYYSAKKKDKKAKQEYQNWMKVRKNQANFKKTRWSYFKSMEYFLSVGEGKLAWELYEELEKLAQETLFTPFGKLEFLVAQDFMINDFYRYNQDKSYRKEIEIKEQQTAHLLLFPELIITDAYVQLDYFFYSKIESALRNNDMNTAERFGNDWLTSLERVADKDKQYKTARYIARSFHDRIAYNNKARIFMSNFLEKSISYAIAKGDAQTIKNAYYNACHCMRVTDQKLEALELIINGKEYFLDDNKSPVYGYVSALRACGNSLYYQDSSKRNKAIIVLQNWKTTLSIKNDKVFINFCNDYIRQLSR
jgi:hypothetical protein